MEDGLSCLSDTNINTQGARGGLADRKPDGGLPARLQAVRFAPSPLSAYWYATLNSTAVEKGLKPAQVANTII